MTTLTAYDKATKNTAALTDQNDFETVEEAFFLLDGVKVQLDAYMEYTYTNKSESNVAFMENIKVAIDHAGELIKTAMLDKEAVVEEAEA